MLGVKISGLQCCNCSSFLVNWRHTFLIIRSGSEALTWYCSLLLLCPIFKWYCQSCHATCPKTLQSQNPEIPVYICTTMQRHFNKYKAQPFLTSYPSLSLHFVHPEITSEFLPRAWSHRHVSALSAPDWNVCLKTNVTALIISCLQLLKKHSSTVPEPKKHWDMSWKTFASSLGHLFDNVQVKVQCNTEI